MSGQIIFGLQRQVLAMLGLQGLETVSPRSGRAAPESVSDQKPDSRCVVCSDERLAKAGEHGQQGCCERKMSL